MLELSSLPARLRDFHALWERKRGSRAFPARQDFPFEELVPWLGELHLIEVLPDDFRFKVFAGKSTARLGQEATGRLLSEFTPRWSAGAACFRRAPTSPSTTSSRGSANYTCSRSWKTISASRSSPRAQRSG